MYLHFTTFAVEKSCGEVTRQNCSYFVNPGFPAPVTNMLACILTVEKAQPDISQIRLDFFMFEVSLE
jgi:molybdopterin-biosynthesis enzyme MoeA-like protein